MAAVDDFDEVLEQYHLALDEIMKGSPDGYKRAYSRRDDVTLANPFGPPLTAEEWKVIKRHPEVGARMIEPLESLSGAVPVIRHHHERPDGSGYPDGLEGEEIPLGAR